MDERDASRVMMITVVVLIWGVLDPLFASSNSRHLSAQDILRSSNSSLVDMIIAVEGYVCENVCGLDFPSPSKTSAGPWSSCQVCGCDSTCIAYQTCCPDVLLTKPNIFHGLGSECVPLSPTEELVEDVSFSSMLTTCYVIQNRTVPSSLSEDDRIQEEIQRSKCEHPDTSKSVELFPVTDITTSVTYQNIYCARCNNVSELSIHSWKAQIICKEQSDWLFISMPSPEKLYEMMTSVKSVNATGCYMTYFPGPTDFRRPCRKADNPIIKTCNETGRWDRRFYDADIERACHAYDSLFKNIYKNIFCYMCNKRISLEEIRDDVQSFGGNPAKVSFLAMVDFSDGHDDVEGDIITNTEDMASTCSQTQFYDNATCVCRDAECSGGNILATADAWTCQRLFQSQCIGYQGCARVEVVLHSGRDILFDVDSLLHRLSNAIETSHRVVIDLTHWCPGSHRLVFHLTMQEKPIGANDWSAIQSAFDQHEERFCTFLEESQPLGRVESCQFQFIEECPSLGRYSSPCKTNRSLRVSYVVVNGEDSSSWAVVDNKICDLLFLSYTKTDRCAFVEIPNDEMVESEDALVRHTISGNSISRSKVDFLQNNTVIRICVVDYLDWVNGNATVSACALGQSRHLRNSDSSSDTWTTAGLISIVTSSISLLFLFLTFMTYVLFDQIKPRGSNNIMVLVVTLFIAQALYEFAIEQYENKILCSIIAILIHYFWLAAIFSMNACSIERFIKLCYPLTSRSFFMSKKPFIIATVYTSTCPFIIVGSNILVNYFVKNQLGYGSDTICYINERYSRIFSFVVPMCVIVVLNTVLFIVTIVKLRKQAFPGDNKRVNHARIGLVACFRLSLVTGVTWLISLLYEALPYPALGYVFTALLGLQGVDFFVSLLGSKKVFAFYATLFKTRLSPPKDHRSNVYQVPVRDGQGPRRNVELQKSVSTNTESKQSASVETDGTDASY